MLSGDNSLDKCVVVVVDSDSGSSDSDSNISNNSNNGSNSDEYLDNIERVYQCQEDYHDGSEHYKSFRKFLHNHRWGYTFTTHYTFKGKLKSIDRASKRDRDIYRSMKMDSS
ncbi:hypothetical protein DFA_00158 [Cavenderia fasciculata]|uniref:Uncharacterized protein n=1 Tax=Cavenderia fasciculata TaxID=261658 RepID=F4PXS0_CACFS|nr:uncharacterized protein DFA_00158 [Cavenderia fasciculata]EGG19580.1 hypothetical protein DFA_00158 [Cavenderia fasciculata]|eukprot:XP_004357874.1 hypothetical protein DFA_00158 [Cavenderia fasciculata]